MNKYLKEAERIAEDILAHSIKEKAGICWETPAPGLNNGITMEKSAGIYSGASGIALFLLYLYKITKKKKYLRAVLQSLTFAENYYRQNEKDNKMFLTGSMSISFLYGHLYKVTFDKKYLENALLIVKEIKPNPETNEICEYLNGSSGTLFCLLFLYSLSADSELLNYINVHIKYLIDNAKFDKGGLYWDRSALSIRGLCGFSHGTSGIGFTLITLGKLFNNKTFYYLAKQAFLYEDYYFDKKINNWPDFRISMYNDKSKKKFINKYKRGELNIFHKAGDFNAWCHGAAGIGLARILAYKLSSDSYFNDSIDKAIAKTLISHPLSFALCHGLAGNAELYLEYYQSTSDKKYLKYALNSADRILDSKKNHSNYTPKNILKRTGGLEDLSLFKGNAGIGYFLLRICDPYNIPSILAPEINYSAGNNLVLPQNVIPDLIGNPDPRVPTSLKATNGRDKPEDDNKHRAKSAINLINLKKKLLQNIFPKTFRLIKYKLNNDTKESAVMLKNKYVKFIKSLNIPSDNLELRKIKMDEDNPNFIYLYIKDMVNRNNAEKLIKLKTRNLTNLLLRRDKDIRLFSDKKYILLKPSVEGVSEIEISAFCYHVLSSFSTGGTKVKDVIKKMIQIYSKLPAADQKIISQKTIQQIIELLRFGTLTT
jgi:hypothetical protein